jgi:hypothetical protein
MGNIMSVIWGKGSILFHNKISFIVYAETLSANCLLLAYGKLRKKAELHLTGGSASSLLAERLSDDAP